MKSGIQMVNDAYPLINIPDITNVINGKVYKLVRPQNSLKTDIVLNALALTNEQLQQGVFNVNLHFQNQANVVIGGESDNTQPDIDAMVTLSNLVVSILNSATGTDFWLYAQNSGIPIRDVDLTWYINIRVNYFSVQQNYANI